jgi:hypothetical protein
MAYDTVSLIGVITFSKMPYKLQVKRKGRNVS